MVVIGVRLVDGRQVLRVDDDQVASQRVGGVAVADAFQAHQQASPVRAGRLDDVAAASSVAIFDRHRRPRREPVLGVVGADLDHELAANAVRFDHTPDRQLHQSY